VGFPLLAFLLPFPPFLGGVLGIEKFKKAALSRGSGTSNTKQMAVAFVVPPHIWGYWRVCHTAVRVSLPSSKWG
jgi:hypothetical protein